MTRYLPSAWWLFIAIPVIGGTLPLLGGQLGFLQGLLAGLNYGIAALLVVAKIAIWISPEENQPNGVEE